MCVAMVLARAPPVRLAAGPVRVPLTSAVPRAFSSSSSSVSSSSAACDARPRQILRRPAGSSRYVFFGSPDLSTLTQLSSTLLERTVLPEDPRTCRRRERFFFNDVRKKKKKTAPRFLSLSSFLTLFLPSFRPLPLLSNDRHRRPLFPSAASSSSSPTRTRATLDGGGGNNNERKLDEKGSTSSSSSSIGGSSSSGGKEEEEDEEEEFSPEPDAAAFANLVVLAACVTALGALTGVDPWATLFPASSDPSATPASQALALGLAASPAYALSLLAARSLVCEGSIWWAEVEGQGALSRLSWPRALAWASAVALADGAAMRGLVLPWLTRLVTAPGGDDVAEVARRAASDEILLKPAAELAAAGLFASPADALVAAGLGSPAMPFPMPSEWLLPVLALAAGAAGAALSCFEPPAGIRAGFRAGPEPAIGPTGERLLDSEGNQVMTMVLGAGIDVEEKPPEGSDAASTMRVSWITFFPFFFSFQGGGVWWWKGKRKKNHSLFSSSLSLSSLFSQNAHFALFSLFSCHQSSGDPLGLLGRRGRGGGRARRRWGGGKGERLDVCFSS